VSITIVLAYLGFRRIERRMNLEREDDFDRGKRR
jgi:hypothetical protein